MKIKSDRDTCELSVLVQACTSLHKHRQENCENTDANLIDAEVFAGIVCSIWHLVSPGGLKVPGGVFGGRASGEDQEKTRNFDIKLWHMT